MMSLLDEIRDLAREVGDDVEGFVRRTAKKLFEEAAEHPQHVFAVLRAVSPILVAHGFAIVTRYDDVVEVLEHDEAFSVSPYTAKMRAVAGDFILGMDDSPEYERDVSILRLAAPRTDPPALAAYVYEQAEALVSEAGGRIDVVDLAARVPARVMARWFGTPGPDERAIVDWTLALFAEIFLNLQGDEDITRRASEVAPSMREHLDEVIRRRKSSGTRSDDVLGRLIAMQEVPDTALTDEQIRTNFVGLIVGFIPTVMTSTTYAFDALLDRPDALAGAREAALTDDDDGLRTYVWEAMRLNPQAPGLIRRASTDYVLAEGTRRAKRIPAGTLTFAATQSAMLDGDVVDDPGDFRTDRPAHDYLHFGTGLHECFGRFMNEVQIPLILKPLLRRRGLRRAEGDDGKLARTLQYPTRLVVEYDT
ncbi:MAG TPA: cytochrome P450, partial [Actinomycetota bacterium]|nr:cytochrome P450 [Actinomycetota bacterium]